jgi:hypothetical protein
MEALLHGVSYLGRKLKAQSIGSLIIIIIIIISPHIVSVCVSCHPQNLKKFFLKQQQPFVLCNGDIMCLLIGGDRIFIVLLSFVF